LRLESDTLQGFQPFPQDPWLPRRREPWSDVASSHMVDLKVYKRPSGMCDRRPALVFASYHLKQRPLMMGIKGLELRRGTVGGNFFNALGISEACNHVLLS